MLGWGLLAQAGVQKASSKDDDEAPDAGQVVERVQEFYEDTKDYQARFKQVYKNKLMNETKKSTGKVYIKRPGKMRWEYEKPSEKLFVSDGETLWVYEKEAQQVYRQKLAESDLPTAIAFLMGEGDLAEDFDYKLIENDKAAAKGLLVLQLVPKEPTTHYKKLLFMVDDGTFQVRRTIIIDASGNTNSMRFSKVKTNKGLSDAEFDFEIPKGASLVE
jgi:outer membrane lipoprotein carrier protein